MTTVCVCPEMPDTDRRVRHDAIAAVPSTVAEGPVFGQVPGAFIVGPNRRPEERDERTAKPLVTHRQLELADHIPVNLAPDKKENHLRRKGTGRN